MTALQLLIADRLCKYGWILTLTGTVCQNYVKVWGGGGGGGGGLICHNPI